MISITYQSPLQWPDGWKRNHGIQLAAFRADFLTALGDLCIELERLGAVLPILSSNLQLRQDGQPRVNQSSPTDPGVAVYFQLNGQAKVMACDHWGLISHNVRAIGLTIAALRGIERWGGLGFQNRAFEGFKALPPGNSATAWWQILEVSPTATRDEILAARRSLAKIYHPDNGIRPNGTMMADINRAVDEALSIQET